MSSKEETQTLNRAINVIRFVWLNEGTMKSIFHATTLVALVLTQTVYVTSANAAEETTIQAFATWQSAGRVYRTGDDKALFVGGLEGIMFVDDGKGDLNTAKIVCPMMMEINLKNDRVSGDGRCIITGAAGNSVFGKWQCGGIALAGCKGKFELTAGTGKFEGVTGSGEIVFRTALSRFARNLSEKSATSIGLGLTAWPRLTYRLPSKK